MSAHKKQEVHTVTNNATTNEEFDELLQKPGLRVFDAYAKWAGPCEAMQNIFKRIKLDIGEDITFSQVQTDGITALTKIRNRSCPTFLFYFNGLLVSVIRGANAPLIEKTIKEQLDLEKSGQSHTPVALDVDEPGSVRLKSRPQSSHATSQTFDDSEASEHTFALIKPDAMHPTVVEEIFELLKRNRFIVVKMKKIWMTSDQVAEFYKVHADKPYYNTVISYLSCAPTLALVLAKDDAVKAWRELMGPQNSKRAKEEFPRSIRALFGTDGTINAVYGSETVESAQSEIEFFFSNSTISELPLTDEETHATPGMASGKTLALIKPDAIAAGKVDEIIQKIVYRGFQVIKREEIQFSEEQAVEMFAEYSHEGYFEEIINFITGSPSIALVLKGEDVAIVWQEMMGPTDPVVAKEKFPQSIRALYGTNIVKNAVHGSSSNDMATKEIQFLFPKALHRSSSQLFAMRSTTKLYGSMSSLSTGHGNGNMERTLAILKPDANQNIEKKTNMMAIINRRGFKVVADMECTLTIEKTKELYKEHVDQPFFEELTTWMSSAPVTIMVLEKAGAISAWREMVGPSNPQQAKEAAPDSLRAIFGMDSMRNAVHGSDSPQSAEREIALLFDSKVSPQVEPIDQPKQPIQYGSMTRLHGALGSRGKLFKSKTSLHESSTRLNNMGIVTSKSNVVKPGSGGGLEKSVEVESTLAIIKPDAYGSGKKDEILQRITDAEFTIYKQKEMTLTRESAESLFDKSNGEFSEEFYEWITSAPVYAMILQKESAVSEWLELSGPEDPVLAKEEAPGTIRGRFATSIMYNAVHCSQTITAASKEIRLIFPSQTSETDQQVSKKSEDAQKNSEASNEKQNNEETHEYTDATQNVNDNTSALEGGKTHSGDATVAKAAEESYDTSTAKRIEPTPPPSLQRTLALIKPDAFPQRKDDIVSKIVANEFRIVAEKEIKMTTEIAQEFYKEHNGKPFFDELVGWMSSEPIYGLVLEKPDSIKSWRALAGPTNSNKAREEAPESIRALFGTDGSKNAVHGSDSQPSANREIELIFGGEFVLSAETIAETNQKEVNNELAKKADDEANNVTPRPPSIPQSRQSKSASNLNKSRRVSGSTSPQKSIAGSKVASRGGSGSRTPKLLDQVNEELKGKAKDGIASDLVIEGKSASNRGSKVGSKVGTPMREKSAEKLDNVEADVPPAQ
ncbi:thioredoxin domain-containing protein 6 [Nowakowskiella sp. JEL0407]|nr:thioredoxin domain-containing protein 6 [Nowakowskiella sp. JEL0407]